MTATTLAASQRSIEGKAATAYERMRSRVPSEAAPSARVRTRKVGFNLGGFGLTFTTKDLEMGSGKRAEIPDLASLDLESLEPSRNYPQYQARQSRSATQTPDTSLMTRKRGTSAYAQQIRRQREEAVPRSVLLSVV